VSGVHETKNWNKLLTAARASGIHVDMMAEEFVAIDDGIATERMGDWEEELVRFYVEKRKDSDGEYEDNDGSSGDHEPVLTIKKAYSIAEAARR